MGEQAPINSSDTEHMLSNPIDPREIAPDSTSGKDRHPVSEPTFIAGQPIEQEDYTVSEAVGHTTGSPILGEEFSLPFTQIAWKDEIEKRIALHKHAMAEKRRLEQRESARLIDLMRTEGLLDETDYEKRVIKEAISDTDALLFGTVIDTYVKTNPLPDDKDFGNIAASIASLQLRTPVRENEPSTVPSCEDQVHMIDTVVSLLTQRTSLIKKVFDEDPIFATVADVVQAFPNILSEHMQKVWKDNQTRLQGTSTARMLQRSMNAWKDKTK